MSKVIVDEKKIEELLSRGVANCIVKEDLKKKLMSGKVLNIKLGADPSASNIHLGNAVAIRALKKFQELGHQVIFIVGDATGMIGDTSDKNSLRPQLTKEDVEKNMAGWKEQVGKILDMSKTRFEYNSTWLSKLNFMDVANLAKEFTVAQMIERENYKLRFEAGKPIGLHEFMYPLMQGYDSVAIEADVELGGSDQLFNILAGRELQQAFGQEPQNLITFELIEGTDGRKMSKSYGNVINLTDTPEDIFGKTMRMGDELIVRYLTICTDMPLEEISTIQDRLNDGENPRNLKVLLAKELVTLYHSKEDAEHAEQEFIQVFSNNALPSEIPEHKVTKRTGLLTIMVDTGLASSNGEARRLIQQGGVKMDGEVITDHSLELMGTTTGIILQRGKRKVVKICL